MPTYAYACTACDHRFEVQQSFTDESLSQCPRCEGQLRKLFNAVGIVFRGSGFYRTDSRNSGDPGKRSSDSSAPAAGKDTAKAGSGTSGSASASTGSNGSNTTQGSRKAQGSTRSSRSSTPASSTSAA